MFKERIPRSIGMLPISVLILAGAFALWSGAAGDGGQSVLPGTRVEGNAPDAILILHNLGTGAGLRVNSEGGGPGIRAGSKSGDGIDAATENSAKSGVWGHSIGGIGVKGNSTNNHGIIGVTAHKDKSGVWGQSIQGVGVTGSSSGNDGIVGWTETKDKSGIWGHSSQGTGVSGFSEKNTGVYGRSSKGIGVIARSDSSTSLFVDGTSVFKGYASFEGGHGDLAENYYAGARLEAGDVAVIDPSGKMTLKPSERSGDTAVAGIISTAPAMKLRGRIADNEGVPLVIAGRTLCKVDAGQGPIRPGDLLTTSPTPGHAMKARPVLVEGVEFYRPGTILGKALESRDVGKGTIMVLVTLH